MSMYVPPDDQGPTGAEGGEFLDDPHEEEVPEIEHPTRVAGESVEDVRDRDRVHGEANTVPPDSEASAPPDAKGES